MNFWETIIRGEYVMFALAVLLLAALCIWWVRSAVMSRLRKSYPALMHRLHDHIAEGDVENARQLCEDSSGAGAVVLCAGVKRIGKPMNEIEGGMKAVEAIEINRLNRGTRWIRAIAVVSPLIGLGGTLVGIVDRLRDLGERGVAVNIADVCSELAPTIVTTVAGLGVGVLALLALVCLEGSISKTSRSLEDLTMEFIDLLNQPS